MEGLRWFKVEFMQGWKFHTRIWNIVAATCRLDPLVAEVYTGNVASILTRQLGSWLEILQVQIHLVYCCYQTKTEVTSVKTKETMPVKMGHLPVSHLRSPNYCLYCVFRDTLYRRCCIQCQLLTSRVFKKNFLRMLNLSCSGADQEHSGFSLCDAQQDVYC